MSKAFAQICYKFKMQLCFCEQVCVNFGSFSWKITFTDSDPVEIICPDVKQPGEYFKCVVDIPTGHDLTAEVIMVDNVMLDQVQAEQYWAVSSKQDTFLPSKPEPMPCLFGPNLWRRI